MNTDHDSRGRGWGTAFLVTLALLIALLIALLVWKPLGSGDDWLPSSLTPGHPSEAVEPRLEASELQDERHSEVPHTLERPGDESATITLQVVSGDGPIRIAGIGLEYRFLLANSGSGRSEGAAGQEHDWEHAARLTDDYGRSSIVVPHGRTLQARVTNVPEGCGLISPGLEGDGFSRPTEPFAVVAGTAGEEPPVVNVHVARFATLYGRVTLDGLPLPGLRVHAYRCAPVLGAAQHQKVTDDDGRYEFERVVPGEMAVLTRGFIEEASHASFDARFVAPRPSLVQVIEGEQLEHDVICGLGSHVLVGRVLDQFDRPVPEVLVSAFYRFDEIEGSCLGNLGVRRARARSTRSGADGRFTVEGMPYGAVAVMVGEGQFSMGSWEQSLLLEWGPVVELGRLVGDVSLGDVRVKTVDPVELRGVVDVELVMSSLGHERLSELRVYASYRDPNQLGAEHERQRSDKVRVDQDGTFRVVLPRSVGEVRLELRHQLQRIAQWETMLAEADVYVVDF
jgi:CBS domain-containing protein